MVSLLKAKEAKWLAKWLAKFNIWHFLAFFQKFLWLLLCKVSFCTCGNTDIWTKQSGSWKHWKRLEISHKAWKTSHMALICSQQALNNQPHGFERQPAGFAKSSQKTFKSSHKAFTCLTATHFFFQEGLKAKGANPTTLPFGKLWYAMQHLMLAVSTKKHGCNLCQVAEQLVLS